MKENSIRRAVREGRAALGTGLKEFLINARGRVTLQPNHWHQRIGKTWPEAEPIYMPASQAETIAILDRLIEAVSLARKGGMGLFFCGE